ncbi:MAG TPA: acyl-CoA thioesterase domain-containing protein [Mycobacteriales bacterium]|nr:acyl-CoA thioesterase domain-containing protein [Mycobacteriales bacterium]
MRPTVADALALAHRADGRWTAPAVGPVGKRAYGGQTCAQAVVAAARTVPTAHELRTVHAQYLRAGDAGTPLSYEVEEVRTGRTASTRRVTGGQDGRDMVSVTATFAEPSPGLEHGRIAVPHRPEDLPMTGPPGPALALPPDAFDIRIADDGAADAFVRRLWWRYLLEPPSEPLLHSAMAVFVGDLYVMEVAARAHGLGIEDRSIRRATTDWALWFHRPVRVEEWNVLELRSPAASSGRGIVLGTLANADGTVLMTMVQEGLLAEREPAR